MPDLKGEKDIKGWEKLSPAFPTTGWVRLLINSQKRQLRSGQEKSREYTSQIITLIASDVIFLCVIVTEYINTAILVCVPDVKKTYIPGAELSVSMDKYTYLSARKPLLRQAAWCPVSLVPNTRSSGWECYFFTFSLFPIKLGTKFVLVWDNFKAQHYGKSCLPLRVQTIPSHP